MLKLLAAAYPDAYALVQDRGQMYFIRPPFRGRTLASPEAVERAVQMHGFVRADAEFASWAALIAHLSGQALEARRAAGRPLPNSSEVRRLMERAPERIIANYLERIRTELLPNGEFCAGRSILNALLRNPRVKASHELLDQCSDLLDACNQDSEIPAGINEPLEDVFPAGFREYGETISVLTAAVRNQHQVWPVGQAQTA